MRSLAAFPLASAKLGALKHDPFVSFRVNRAYVVVRRAEIARHSVILYFACSALCLVTAV